MGRRAGPQASARARAPIHPSRARLGRGPAPPARLTHDGGRWTRTQAATPIRASILAYSVRNCSKLPQIGRIGGCPRKKQPCRQARAQSDGARRVSRAAERTRKGINPHAFQEQKGPRRGCGHRRNRRRGAAYTAGSGFGSVPTAGYSGTAIQGPQSSNLSFTYSGDGTLIKTANFTLVAPNTADLYAVPAQFTIQAGFAVADVASSLTAGAGDLTASNQSGTSGDVGNCTATAVPATLGSLRSSARMVPLLLVASPLVIPLSLP